MPVCNALDMPTSVWSEMARKSVEPLLNLEKQMTTDARRLMRPGASAERSSATAAIGEYCQAVRPRLVGCWVAGRPISKARPYEDLSRMKGNFHVRFLVGCGRGNRLHLPDQGVPAAVPKR